MYMLGFNRKGDNSEFIITINMKILIEGQCEKKNLY